MAGQDKCKKAKNVCHSPVEENRRKRMLRHIRRNPFDHKARDDYWAHFAKRIPTMGDIPIDLLAKGRKVIRRVHVKLQLRYDRNQIRLARLEAAQQRALAGETVEQLVIAEGVGG